MEFVFGDGSEAADYASPLPSAGQKAGKFWGCEQAIWIPFYCCRSLSTGGQSRPTKAVRPIQEGIIRSRRVELGIQDGSFNQVLP